MRQILCAISALFNDTIKWAVSTLFNDKIKWTVCTLFNDTIKWTVCTLFNDTIKWRVCTLFNDTIKWTVCTLFNDTIKWTVCTFCLMTCSAAQPDIIPSTFGRNDCESDRLHGVIAQDDDNLHTQHSENLKFRTITPHLRIPLPPL